MDKSELRRIILEILREEAGGCPVQRADLP